QRLRRPGADRRRGRALRSTLGTVLGLIALSGFLSIGSESTEAGPWDAPFWQAAGVLTKANAESTLTAAKSTATSSAAFYGTAIAAVPTTIWSVQLRIADTQATATTAAIRSQSALSQATRDTASKQTEDAFATRAALYQTATVIPATATPIPPTATAASALGHVRIADAEHLVATVELGEKRGTATAVAATAAAMIANALATLPPAEQTVVARAAAATATAVEAARIIGSIPSIGSGGQAPPPPPPSGAPPPPPPPPSGPIGAGSVFALRGTPHLWIMDGFGILHWGGDTRGLSDKTIDWGNRREVGLSEILSRPIGDPWLSAGLVKIGDPIYLVKWEMDQAVPILLHIQSLTDVQTFGINANNYGNFVLEAAQWEATYGIPLGTLIRATLPRAQ
ncbi:MAG TPA: hypothetical protein VFN74_19270, partial [Chloroflexota bacterium]|nr:hypothetical protein [Chloroflexota bacterium]